MPAAVQIENEVSLYGVPYPIVRPITPHRVQPFGGRFVIGDPTRSDQLVISEWIMADWRGGLGVFEMDERTQQDRFWDANGLTMFKRQFTPPLAATDTGNGSATGSPVVYAFAELGSNLYAAFGTAVKQFNNSTGIWGSTLVTLAGNPFSAIVFDGKLYFFCSTAYDYSADGSTWTRVTETGRYACIFDDKLVTLDNNGLVKYSLDGVSWLNLLQLPLAAGNYNGLDSFWNGANEPCLVVGTKYGLYTLDFWTQKYYETVLRFAPSSYGGRLLPWKDGNLYVADGLPIHRFSGSSVAPVGLDRDDGLPSDFRGNIVNFARSPNWLIAVLDATSVNASTTGWIYGAAPLGADVVNKAVGFSAILAWTGVGWHFLFKSSSLNTGSQVAFFSTVHSEYRLWFGADGKAYYIVVPEGVYNPLDDASARYALTGDLTTPCFDGGFTESPKVAVSLALRGKNLTSTNYYTVYYAMDGATTWTLLTTATTNNPSPVRFAGGPGVEFKNIRFKFVATGDAAATPPALLFASLRLRKVPATVWGWSFQVDCTKPYRGRSSTELIRSLKLAGDSKTPDGTDLTMGEFTFRDGTDALQTFWVSVTNLVGREWTGEDERAVFDVTVVAP